VGGVPGDVEADAGVEQGERLPAGWPSLGDLRRSRPVGRPLRRARVLVAGDTFDAILAVNSLGFWPAPAQRLAGLRRRLAPGGRIAIASQPRCPGATADTSRAAAREIEDLLTEAGFTRLSTQTLPLSPPVACVLAASDASRSTEVTPAPGTEEPRS